MKLFQCSACKAFCRPPLQRLAVAAAVLIRSDNLFIAMIIKYVNTTRLPNPTQHIKLCFSCIMKDSGLQRSNIEPCCTKTSKVMYNSLLHVLLADPGKRSCAQLRAGRRARYLSVQLICNYGRNPPRVSTITHHTLSAGRGGRVPAQAW